MEADTTEVEAVCDGVMSVTVATHWWHLTRGVAAIIFPMQGGLGKMGFQKLSLHPLPPLSEVIIVKTEGQKKNHLENNYDSNYHSPFLAEEIRINPGERVAWGGLLSRP